MSTVVIRLLLVLAFMLCYLQWADQSRFIFQMEYEILFRPQASNFAHPLILLPFLGQILILVTLFLKQVRKWMIYAGILLMGVLVLMVFLAGALSLNGWIVLSTLPFITVALLLIRALRKRT